MRVRVSTLLATVTVFVALAAMPAAAGCQRLGFSVNDYGKEGPTRDAKDLLDKYIVQWTAENGVKKYTVGKKEVTCELFLDFIIFDEHTCKAVATVCWSGAPYLETNVPDPAEKSQRPAKSPPAPKKTADQAKSG